VKGNIFTQQLTQTTFDVSPFLRSITTCYPILRCLTAPWPPPPPPPHRLSAILPPPPYTLLDCPLCLPALSLSAPPTYCTASRFNLLSKTELPYCFIGPPLSSCPSGTPPQCLGVQPVSLLNCSTAFTVSLT
jgi:hypothetical protein